MDESFESVSSLRVQNKKNSSKISKEQRAIMVAFLENNKKFVDGKFSAAFTQDMFNQMWEDLATELNSQGSGAFKTVKQWKKCLADWKSLTKAKAARIMQSQNGTGGGQKTAEKLSELEGRLVAVIGWTAVTGNNIVREGGFPRPEQATVNEEAEPIAHCSRNPAPSALEQIIYYNDDGFSLSPEEHVVPEGQGNDNRHSTPISRRASPVTFSVPRTPPRRENASRHQQVCRTPPVISQPNERRRSRQNKAPYSRELKENSTESFFKTMQELQERQTRAAEATLAHYGELLQVKKRRVEVEEEKATALTNIAEACYRLTKQYLKLTKDK